MREGIRGALEQFKVLSRDTKLLLLASFLIGIYWSILFVVFQFYLLEAGYNATMIGLVGFIRNIISTFLMLFSGFIGDYYGRRRVTLLGFFLVFLGLLISAFSPSLLIILLGSSLIGIGGSLGYPCLLALFTDTIKSKEEMNFVFGLQSFSMSISFAVGSGLGWLPQILQDLGLESIFTFQITLLLTSIIMLLSLFPVIITKVKDVKKKRRFTFKLKSRDVVIRFAIINSIIGIGAGLTVALFPTYFERKFMVSSGEMGTLQASADIINAFAYLSASRLAQLFGGVITISYSSALSVLALILIPISPNFLIASFPFIVRQSLVNLGFPLIYSLMMKLAHKEERATVIGLSNFFWSLTFSLAQPIGGYMIDFVWVDLPLIITGIFYLFYSLFVYILFSKQDR